MSFADLLNQATPGPWEMDAYEEGLDVRAPEHAVARLAGVMTMGEDADPGVKARALGDAALIALAPDMARLLIDMADYVSRDVVASAALPSRDALLTRFAALDAKAGGTE